MKGIPNSSPTKFSPRSVGDDAHDRVSDGVPNLADHDDDTCKHWTDAHDIREEIKVVGPDYYEGSSAVKISHTVTDLGLQAEFLSYRADPRIEISKEPLRIVNQGGRTVNDVDAFEVSVIVRFTLQFPVDDEFDSLDQILEVR